MPTTTFFQLDPTKRQRVIDAAVAEFASVPYARANLDRVVAAAGISKGSMYQYFRDKEDVYVWLLAEYLPGVKMQILEHRTGDQPRTCWEILEEAFVSGLRFAQREPRLTELGLRFQKDKEVGPAAARVAAEQKRLASVWLQSVLETGKAGGDVRPDLDDNVAVMLLAHALGEGSLEMLARHLGKSLDDVFRDVSVLEQLCEPEIRLLVRRVILTLRQGMAP